MAICKALNPWGGKQGICFMEIVRNVDTFNLEDYPVNISMVHGKEIRCHLKKMIFRV